MTAADWIPIAISVMALAFSGYTWSEQRQEATRAREREYLESFLVPLQMTLDGNRRLHRELTADTKLEDLEFAPDYVQKALHVDLAPDDPRRIMWRVQIDRLMAENDKAIELIETYVGRVPGGELASTMMSFKEHAHKWKDMWRAVLNPDPSEARSFAGRDRLRSPPYPQALDDLLKGEIVRVRAAAGLNRM